MYFLLRVFPASVFGHSLASAQLSCLIWNWISFRSVLDMRKQSPIRVGVSRKISIIFRWGFEQLF